MIDWDMFEYIGLSRIVIPISIWFSLNPLGSVCCGMDDWRKVWIILSASFSILTFIDAKGDKDTKVRCSYWFPYKWMGDMTDSTEWYV